jgi:hypothetical protein
MLVDLSTTLMKTLLKRMMIGGVGLAGLILMLAIGIYSQLPSYPYGWSHCCLKGLGLALLQYAKEHGGHFPAGGGCPEASLSLLYREKYDIDAYTLCGKTKSAEAAREILERGELLGPDTCDWHYVEGLTLSDDPQLALVWDKVGLGHNGQRLSDGGHSIWRVGGLEEVIPDSEWPQFLEDQKRLIATRAETAKKGLPVLTAKVRLPSGEVVDHYDASYLLCETTTYASGGGGGGTSSGFRLDKSMLQWYRLRDDCTLMLTLSLGEWTSKPVTVQVSHGKAVPDVVVFEMGSSQGERSK